MRALKLIVLAVLFTVTLLAASTVGWFAGDGELYAKACPAEKALTWCGGPF